MPPNHANVDLDKAADEVLLLLAAIGEDPGRDGLIDTPVRISRSAADVLDRCG